LVTAHGGSLAIAVLVSASVVWTAKEAPLPALGWAAAFLFLAVEQDVRGMRIRNWLTLPALAGALCLAGWTGGWVGLQSALAGAGAAFGILFIPFVFRWLGAGDVKAVMVLGALWGVEFLLPVLWWMILVGGILAIAMVAARGGLLDLLRRWGSTVVVSLRTGRLTYFGPAPGAAAAGGVPFAIAMGLGAAAYQVWGTPWA
jgi:prepilin peptidase CpaA